MTCNDASLCPHKLTLHPHVLAPTGKKKKTAKPQSLISSITSLQSYGQKNIKCGPHPMPTFIFPSPFICLFFPLVLLSFPISFFSPLSLIIYTHTSDHPLLSVLLPISFLHNEGIPFLLLLQSSNMLLLFCIIFNVGFGLGLGSWKR